MKGAVVFALAIAVLTTPAQAQFGGFDGGGGGGGPFSNGGGGGGGGRTDAYDVASQRMAHGIVACLAFAVLFPLGALLVRVVPGAWSARIHYTLQMLAWLLYLAGFALGVALVRQMQTFGGGSLLSNPATNAHPVIGIVVFLLLLIQPLLGYVHHRNFKIYQKRTAASHLHLWDGRISIVLGIVNGGLGLQLAEAPHTAKLAYAIVAGILGGAWILSAVLSEVGRVQGDVVSGPIAREETAVEVRMKRLTKANGLSGDKRSSGESRE